MNLDAKLALLGEAARFDLCNAHSRGGRRYVPAPGWATPADDVERRQLPLFRVLMSSQCAWNCAYCPLRAAADLPRAALEPAELVDAFLPRYETGAVQGLFLSTAVHDSVGSAMSRLLDGVELLRTKHAYHGYVHVKLLPGAAASDVERAARLADRISLNLEAPDAAHLARVSPERSWAIDLIERLRWARDWQAADGSMLKSGLATQFVVGAAGEHDRDLLGAGHWLYRDLGLRRVYFAPFRPIVGTPLAALPATPQLRVQRIQQADWLLRQYGFQQTELPFDPSGDLPLHLDPKLAWALAHPEHFPLELNSAASESLMRVPGLGPISVKRILRLRRLYPFRDPAQLAALGSQAARARDFVTLSGRFFGRSPAELLRAHAPRGPVAEQLTLW